MKRRALLTGAHGLLGARARAALERHGFDVVGLVRNPLGPSELPFRLGETPPASVFEGVDVLVHAAHDFKAFTWEEMRRTNVEGSIALLQAARAGGVKRIIFVSTISAFEGCRSLYGQGKLEVERATQALGGVVVRPGLIFGDPAKGVFGSLSRIARLPVLPVFSGGSQPFYLCHVDDVATLIAVLADSGESAAASGPITAANPTAVPFRTLLKDLGRLSGRSPVIFSVPASLGLLGLRTLEGLGVRIGFRSDSLIGLIYPNAAPDFSALARLGVSFREFDIEESATPIAKRKQ